LKCDELLTVLKGLPPSLPLLKALSGAIWQTGNSEKVDHMEVLVEVFEEAIQKARDNEFCEVLACFSHLVVRLHRVERTFGKNPAAERLIAVFRRLIELLNWEAPQEVILEAVDTCYRDGFFVFTHLADLPEWILKFARSRLPPLLRAARALCKGSKPLSGELAGNLITFYSEIEIEDDLKVKAILKLLSVFPAPFPIAQTYALFEKFISRTEGPLFERLVQACCRTVGLAGVPLWIERADEIKKAGPFLAVVSMPLDQAEEFHEEVTAVVDFLASHLDEGNCRQPWNRVR
jgi:hypothetical protein